MDLLKNLSIMIGCSMQCRQGFSRRRQQDGKILADFWSEEQSESGDDGVAQSIDPLSCQA